MHAYCFAAYRGVWPLGRLAAELTSPMRHRLHPSGHIEHIRMLLLLLLLHVCSLKLLLLHLTVSVYPVLLCPVVEQSVSVL